MKLDRIYSLLLAAIALGANAQDVIIVKAKIHDGNLEYYENGLLVSESGILSYVGEFSETILAKYDTTNPEVVYLDKSENHVYPGLIAMNTTLGITEIDLVRATHDFDEVGQNNANVRSEIAFNTDSKVVPTVRSNGILMAEVAPRGSLISGTSSLMYTQAWNWEDASIRSNAAMHIVWPSSYNIKGWWAEPANPEANKNYDKVQELQNIMNEAQAHFNVKKLVMDAKDKALVDVFSGKRKLFVHADKAADIYDAILFFANYGITPVIVGGQESYKLLSVLKSYQVPVVLVRTHALPAFGHSDIQSIYNSPKLLADSGILFAITDQNHWQQRNLPFQAGTAVAFGLDKEKAIQSICYTPAKLLGVSDRLGALIQGKESTFIISEGDILDMRTSNVIDAYMMGKKVDLNNKQKALHQKFMKKYFD